MISVLFCVNFSEYPDVCVSNPCNNAGTCHVTSDGGYNCTCPQGFTGDICDNGKWTSNTMKLQKYIEKYSGTMSLIAIQS